MAARVFCKVGALAGLDAEIGAEAIFGRHASSTVELAAAEVSGQHLRIVHDPAAGCYVIEDLGSTNGTSLDGVPVHGPERLGHLNVINLAGKHDIVFQDLELCARRAAPPATTTEPATPSIAGADEESSAGGQSPAETPEAERTLRLGPMPVALPDVLAGPSDEHADERTDETPSIEQTRIDALPAPLPGILAAGTPEKPTEEVSAAELEELFLSSKYENPGDEE